MPKQHLALVGAGGKPPPRSAARERLAEQIAPKAERDVQREGSARAIGIAEQSVASARTTLNRCEQALAEAKIAAGEHLTAQALGTAGEAPTSIREARATRDTARDELDAAEQALQAVQERAGGLGGGEWQDRAVRGAAIGALAESPAIEQALQRAEHALRELADAASAITWLQEAGIFPVERSDFQGDHANRVRPLVRACEPYKFKPGHHGGLLDMLGVKHPQRAALNWQAALDALMRDADLPLPGEQR